MANRRVGAGMSLMFLSRAARRSAKAFPNPEVHVVPKWDRMADVGVTAADLGYTVNSLIDGAYAGDYITGGDKIDLTIVGPEAPLTAGIVDRFNERELRAFGPSRKAAELEGSKVYSKNFMRKHDLPTAEFRTFHDLEAAKSYLANILAHQEDNGRWLEQRGPYPPSSDRSKPMARLFPRKGRPSKWITAKAMAVLKKASSSC